MGISRRTFLKTSALSIGGLVCSGAAYPGLEGWEEFIRGLMDSAPIPGLAACFIKGGAVTWSKGFGWADIDRKIPYDPDRTIQNIGSVSKTITATAVMQLSERGRCALDEDVNSYLPFAVRNPRFPDVPITIRQLLTHRSSILDGPAYDESYRCGDPELSLGRWLEGYFKRGGEFFDPENNFHTWKPGREEELPEKPRPYTNVGFGLLGYLVEVIAKLPFAEYCRSEIFEPLGMTRTSWYLRDLDLSQHARPYTYIPAGESRAIFREGGREDHRSESGGFVPHCLYSFPNFPDGLVRTSVNQLSRFLLAILQEGALEGNRILKKETIRTIFSREHFGEGLCWTEHPLPGGDSLWAHSGGDPGINALMCFRTPDKAGFIVMGNTDDVKPAQLLRRWLQEV
jgi:CubicO group peptidase (beta-lactamase class C family)